MTTVRAYLIYRAHDQNLRIVRTRPTLAWDEIAFTVDLKIPNPWGRLAGAVVIELPEGAAPVVEIAVSEEPT